MPRIVLVLLAALATVIGLVMGAPAASWLFGAAGLLVLAAIALWGWNWQHEQRRKARRPGPRADPPQQQAEKEDGGGDLRSLGIMDIRPREEREEIEGEKRDASASAREPSATPAQPKTPEPQASVSAPRPVEPEPAEATPPEATPPEATPPEATPPEKAGSEAGEARPKEPEEPAGTPERPDAAAEAVPDAPVEADALPAAGEAPAAEEPASPPSPDAAPDAPPSLGPLVRAVRRAAGAQAACLLAQEELALDYRVAAADADPGVPALREAGTTFSAEQPLLSARAARRAVTRQSAAEAEAPLPRAHYRAEAPEAPEAMLLVPVPLPDEPATYFLLLDGAPALLDADDALLERFAGLFATLLAPSDPLAAAPLTDAEALAEVPAGLASGSSNAEPAEGGPPTPAAHAGGASDGARPRSEIIAEEMQQARSEGTALALALVYLNRAEAVAERGEDEVEGAERALRARLRRALPQNGGGSGGRVERFGELTYGVFLRRGRGEAEQWAVALQDELADASDPLEGGVSVGLAPMRGPEQPPEDLRENATHALREAYTTGTCTILE